MPPQILLAIQPHAAPAAIANNIAVFVEIRKAAELKMQRTHGSSMVEVGWESEREREREELGGIGGRRSEGGPRRVVAKINGGHNGKEVQM